MPKYTYEEKKEAIDRVLKEGMSPNESAKILGCRHSTVEIWVDNYKAHGEASLHKGISSYDGDFKLHVVEYMHANELSYRAAAIKFGVKTSNNVAKWERIYCEEGPEALYIDRRGRPRKMREEDSDEQTKEDLIAEVQRLRMENEYLKKLRALVQERIARENGKEPPSSTN